MKKSEVIRKQMEACQAKIEEAFAKFMESASDADKASWKSVTDTYDELEESYQDALRAEALQDGNPTPSAAEDAATRSDKKAQISEEVKTFIHDLREAVTYGQRFNGTIPNEIGSQIQYKREQIAGIRNLCTVHKVGGEYTLTIEGDAVTVNYVDSSGSHNYQAADVLPDAIQLAPLKFGAIAKVDNDLLLDAAVDLVDYISTIYAKALVKKEDHEILFGAGHSGDRGKIRGIACASATTTVVTAKSATKVTMEELTSTFSKLKAYKPGSTAIISAELADMIQGLKDPEGRYYFDQTKDLSTLRGVTFKVSDQMPAIANGAVAMVVGNFQYYHIADRQDMKMQILVEMYAEQNKTGFLVDVREDGDFVPAAFAVLKMGAGA